MGTVYVSFDEVLDRRVAIKVLNASEETAHRRVLREAKAMAQLSHPHVVQVFEVGREEGRDFIAMEYVDGPSLDDWQFDAVHSWQEVLAVYQQAGEGLAAAHAAGIVHRDFKPHNVLLRVKDGIVQAKVADFGIARNDELVDSADLDGGRVAALGRNVETAGPRGSPAYMAPEQFTDATITAAADQYSFCVALWEALHGRRPFQADGMALQLQLALDGRPHDPPSGTHVPNWIRMVLSRGLAPEAADRHASMTALLTALDRDPGRNRRRWVAGLGVVVAAGALAWSWPTPEQPCSGAAAKLEEVWNDVRREAIGRAFAATQVPYADTTWDSLRAKLDVYAQDWVAMHTDACQATTVRGEQSSESLDLRMECLHRAHVQLDIVTGMLENADERVVREAGDLLNVLDAVEQCGDVARLRAERVPPRPENASRVDALRTKVARARAEIQIGRYQDGETLLLEAREESSDLEYLPLSIEIDLELGFVYRPLSRPTESLEAYRRALRASTRLLDRTSMFRATVGLMYVTGHLQRDPDGALPYLELAMGLAHGNSERRSSLLRIQGLLAEGRGQLAEAESFHREALEVHDELPQRDPKITIRLRVSLANVLVMQDRPEEAQSHYDRALATVAEHLGETHPHGIAILSNLGALYGRSGRHEQARDTFARALSAYEALYGPDSRYVGMSQVNLARAHEDLGDYERAIELASASRQTYVRVMGPKSRGAGGATSVLASSYRALGRLDQAEASYRDAIEIMKDTQDRRPLAQAYSGLGWTLNMQSRFEAAMTAFESAMENAPDDAFRQRTRVGLGTAQVELGRFDDALPILKAAWTTMETNAGSLRRVNAFSLAQASWETSNDPAVRGRALDLARIAASEAAEDDEQAIAAAAKAWLDEREPDPPQ